MDEKRSGNDRRPERDRRKGGTSSYNGPERRSLKFRRGEATMTEKQTHDKCKSFSYKKCPHRSDEIMKKATQDMPQYYGGDPVTMVFPTDEEINEICDKCDMFIQK